MSGSRHPKEMPSMTWGSTAEAQRGTRVLQYCICTSVCTSAVFVGVMGSPRQGEDKRAEALTLGPLLEGSGRRKREIINSQTLSALHFPSPGPAS